MLIEKNIIAYIVFSDDSLISALKKISENQSRTIFAVSQSGRMVGVMTDGDFRRWVTGQKEVDLNRSVGEVVNRNFASVRASDPPEQVRAGFSERITILPMLDEQNHLVAVAHRDRHHLQIGDFSLSSRSPVFVIAEIGNNHQGDLNMAKRLVDKAVEAGADCAKFQMRHLESLYSNQGNPDDAREDLGSQYTLDLLSRFNLGQEALFEVFDYCREKGILPLCTPWDATSVEALERYGIEGYKVASADLTNHDLLRVIAATNKPILLSTGMSKEQEIIETATLLQGLGAPFALLHCNATYPAPFKDINLNYMERLREIGGCPVGYSGHERGYHIALAAVALGARLVEKHFTLDCTLEGNDHKVSLEPEAFGEMVTQIRQVEEAMGHTRQRVVTQGEMMNRENLAKSVVAACPIAQGDIISEAMLTVRSPGKGLQPNRKTALIGRPAPRDMAAWDFFYDSDLETRQTRRRRFQFKRPWGIPVRFHDYGELLEGANPDLLEFHLSYKDLEADLESFFTEPMDMDLVVHSPELFSGDHIMDLCADDADYRARSVQELQRVIDLTRRLKPWFKRSVRPCIVTNVGGFTTDKPLPVSERAALYARVAESLARVDSEGVEVIPQTMPPFPWHFGGQSHHNIFVSGQEIVDFCKTHGVRICLDISHSKLACTHDQVSFHQFVESVGPYVAHLHVVDAQGADGEGLQIGEGEIDFQELGRILARSAPKASFIPEVWQGHKNNGEGFWFALNALEGVL